MALPDFLVIGAMKCGTSTLAAQLGAQPGLFMTTPKEPNFFSDDDVFARGLGWYESLFEPAAPGDLLGEASTHYTKLPTHPHALERLAAVIEAPRLVYLVRDPIDRVVSHFIHEWTMGKMKGSLDDALDRYPELVDYSRYGFQVAPWVERFGAGSICLLGLDEMKRDPQGVLERVCRHIGYPGRPEWQEEKARVNASEERIRRLPFHDILVESAPAKKLRRALVPKRLRDAVRESRQMHDRPSLSAPARARLEQVFAEDREVLARLFPGAPALTGCYPFLAP